MLDRGVVRLRVAKKAKKIFKKTPCGIKKRVVDTPTKQSRRCAEKVVFGAHVHIGSVPFVALKKENIFFKKLGKIF